MNIRWIYIVFILFLIFSCEPEPQTDYVELVIPQELIGNKDAIAELEADAKKLNNVFNSFEEILNKFVGLRNDIDAFNEDTEIEQYRRKLKKEVEAIQWSVVKLAVNTFWLSTKNYSKDKGHKEILKKLANNEAVVYKKCLNHLNVRKEVLKEKLDAFEKEFKELSNAIEKKEELLDRKLKQEKESM